MATTELKDILAVRLTDGWALEISVGPIMWLILVLLSALFIWRPWRSRGKRWEPVEIEIPFRGGGKVKVVPNHDVIKIAHQAWTEIITRKAGLKFDEDHDVIVEVYDSWHELFSEIRLLIKNIPAQRLRESEDARRPWSPKYLHLLGIAQSDANK